MEKKKGCFSKFKIKKIEGLSLNAQLITVTIMAALISAISFGYILPNILKPYYEEYIYQYLRQPANVLEVGNNKLDKSLTYIIQTDNGAIYISNNFKKMFGENAEATEIISLSVSQYGKIKYNDKIYYYYWNDRINENTGIENATKNLVLIDDSLIESQKENLFTIMFPTMITTIVITVALTYIWSNRVVDKIKRIKNKTKLLSTDKYVNGPDYVIDDELSSLSNAIDIAQQQLREKEEYKNFMFQNLSHELKTPLAVIESYVEAIDDEVIEKDEAIKVIKEEANNLKKQISVMLQFNKIDYIGKDMLNSNEQVNIVDVAQDSMSKHSLLRKDVKFEIESKESVMFRGTYEMWATVFDNILGNFTRYAKSLIHIEIQKNKITLYNDGEHIEENILNKLFTPYVKGSNGQTGLGLSIAKKIVQIFRYDMEAKNIKEGVIFVIKSNEHK